MALCGFLESTKLDLGPIIDKVFDFNDTLDALEYMSSGKVFGKVIVRIS